jgi:hypothetical protein
MDEQTVVAESSAAPVTETATETPSLEVPRSGPEYTEWRKTGNLPEKKQPEPAASATAPSDDAVDSAATTMQEHSKRKEWKDQQRWKELTDRTKQLERELEEARRPKTTQAEPSPAKPEHPQTYAEYRKQFKPSQWIEDYAKANPEASYEDANAAMADHLLDARDHFRSIEQRVTSEKQALESKVGEARSRYENFDEIKSSFLSKVVSDRGTPLIPLQVLGIINDSDVLPDLLYTIGSDSAEMQKFVDMAKSNPNKAIRYITRVEGFIQEELSKGSSARNEKGQFAKTEEPAPTPAKRGPESAPEPPIEIQNRGGVVDASDRALKNVERGSSKDFRAWKEAEDRKELARRRGA